MSIFARIPSSDIILAFSKVERKENSERGWERNKINGRRENNIEGRPGVSANVSSSNMSYHLLQAEAADVSDVYYISVMF